MNWCAACQWCSNTTKLQDQDHLFFQDKGQDHFFKTKTAFLKTIKLLTQDLKKLPLQKKLGQLCWICRVMPVTEKKPCLLQTVLSSFASSKIRILRSEIWLRPKLGF